MTHKCVHIHKHCRCICNCRRRCCWCCRCRRRRPNMHICTCIDINMYTECPHTKYVLLSNYSVFRCVFNLWWLNFWCFGTAALNYSANVYNYVLGWVAGGSIVQLHWDKKNTIIQDNWHHTMCLHNSRLFSI